MSTVGTLVLFYFFELACLHLAASQQAKKRRDINYIGGIFNNHLLSKG
jgi:hypothetical protein